MASQYPRVFDFRNGANTTALGHTSAFPLYQDFAEAVVDRASAVRRLGKAAVHTFTAVSDLIDFDGTNDAVALPASMRSAISALTKWTVEMLFVADTISSDRQILGGTTAADPGIMVKHTSSSDVIVTVTDASANVATLTWTSVAAGTLCGLQVKRDGATITGWLNGATKTGTIGAATALATGLYTVGADNGGSWLDGCVDHLTGWNFVKTTTRDVFMRAMFPRSKSVLFDYVFTNTAANHVLDRSTLEAHGTTSGTPASTRAPLAPNSDPVLALDQNVDTSGKTQAYAIVKDRAYPVRLT